MFGAEFITAEKLTWLCYKILSTATDISTTVANRAYPYARKRFRRNFLLQHDNAPPHRAHARVVQYFLQQQQIDQLPWPAYSPDCNPIEHAWDALDRAVRSRDVQTSNFDEVSTALQEEWRNIGQRSIHKLVENMPRRIQGRD